MAALREHLYISNFKSKKMKNDLVLKTKGITKIITTKKNGK